MRADRTTGAEAGRVMRQAGRRLRLFRRSAHATEAERRQGLVARASRLRQGERHGRQLQHEGERAGQHEWQGLTAQNAQHGQASDHGATMPQATLRVER